MASITEKAAKIAWLNTDLTPSELSKFVDPLPLASPFKKHFLLQEIKKRVEQHIE